MPRLARIVLAGAIHHVTQRGNNRQDVFFVDDDRRHYLKLLHQQAGRYGLKIMGYCLMTNHIHLLAEPAKADSLAKALGRTHWLYTRYVNRLHGRSGHLWQNRFYSCGVQDTLIGVVLRYIEQNPQRAAMVPRASQWTWSSAAAHCGAKADEGGLLDLHEWNRRPLARNWAATLEEPLDDAALGRIRLATHRGRPLASDGFLAKLEQKLGRRLRPLPVGRPRQAQRSLRPPRKRPTSARTEGK